MDYNRVKFSGHAIRQMFDSGLKQEDVLTVVSEGEVIINYPDDTPYPSCLVLGFVRHVPIHAVFAVDEQQKTAIIVTAYVPDPTIWTNDFRRRKGSQ